MQLAELGRANIRFLLRYFFTLPKICITEPTGPISGFPGGYPGNGGRDDHAHGDGVAGEIGGGEKGVSVCLTYRVCVALSFRNPTLLLP